MKYNQIIKLVILIGAVYSKSLAQNQNYVYKQDDPSNGGTLDLASFNNDVHEVAVNYNTGVGNISIPIYSIANGQLSLPVSLNYITSGIKVDQPASDFGLGWFLSAGGNITRVIKGLPDEKFYLSAIGSNPAQRNLLFNTELEKSYYSSSWFNYNQYTSNKLSAMNSCEGHLRIRDAQPDLFTLNIPGRTISFVFDLNQNPVLLDNSYDIKITFQSNAFDVIDENGIKYFFSSTDAEKTEINANTYASTVHDHIIGKNYINVDTDGDDVTCNGSPTEYANTNWMLTKIESPDGKSSINFEYENYVSRRLGSAALLYNVDQNTNLPHAPFLIHAFYPNTPNINIDTYFEGNWLDMQSKRLKKINWKNENLLKGYLTFEHNTPRLDVEDQFSFEKSLDFIKIFNAQDIELKRFSFNYSYFNSAIATTDSWLLWQNKKLKLNSITEYSSDLIAKPSYQFEYDPTPIAIKLSYQQDFWGYYNGNNATTLQGTIYHNSNYSNTNTANFALWSPFCIYPLNLPGSGGGGAYTTINGADRLPNINYAKAGALIKVTYPTGGSLSMDFESNDFCVDYDLKNRLAGGLRIMSTTVYDGINHANDIVKNYYYKLAGVRLPNDMTKSSGKINFLPSMGYYSRYVRTNGDPLSYPYPLSYLYDCYKVSAYDLASSLTGNESRVYYDEVKVEEPGKGYTVYKYNNYGTFGHNNDVMFSGSPIINKVKTQTASYVCPSYNTPAGDEVYSESENLYKNTNYPYSPEPNTEWALGELKEVNMYNESSILVSKKVYNYVIKSLNKVHGYITTSKAIFDKNMPRTSSIALSKFNYLSVWKVLNGVTEYLYDPANASLNLSKATNYEYNSPNHKFLTATASTDSKGEMVRVENTYVVDCNIASASSAQDDATLAIRKMKHQTHQLNSVVENTIYKVKGTNKYLLGGSINLYRDFNNTLTNVPNSSGFTMTETNNPPLIRLNESYSYETALPVLANPTNYLPFNLSYNSSGLCYYRLFDSHYKRKVMNERCDVVGNLLQQKIDPGFTKSIIYGYNHTMAIAEITNAKAADCGFTSFESDDHNLWENASGFMLSSDAHCGAKSCNMAPTGVIARNYFLPINDQNKKFILSCWIKTNSAATGTVGTLVLCTIENNGSNLQYPGDTEAYQSLTFGNTNGQWKYIEIETDLPGIKNIAGIPLSTDLGIRSFVWNTSGSTQILVDDLRFYPKDARMETYTHIPLVGVSSMSDENSNCIFYEYDTFGRLKITKDQNGKILEKTDYNYKP